MKNDIESEVALYEKLIELNSRLIYEKEFEEGKHKHFAILNDIIFEDYQEILNLLEKLIYKIYCNEYRGIFKLREIKNSKPIMFKNKRREGIPTYPRIHNYLNNKDIISYKLEEEMFEEDYWIGYLNEVYIDDKCSVG